MDEGGSPPPSPRVVRLAEDAEGRHGRAERHVGVMPADGAGRKVLEIAVVADDRLLVLDRLFVVLVHRGYLASRREPPQRKGRFSRGKVEKSRGFTARPSRDAARPPCGGGESSTSAAGRREARRRTRATPELRGGEASTPPSPTARRSPAIRTRRGPRGAA